MKKIIFKPEEVWGLFQKEREALRRHTREIACDPEHEVVIMLSAVVESGEEYPNISVLVGDNYYYEEDCINQEDCERTVGRFYSDYIYDENLGYYANFVTAYIEVPDKENETIEDDSGDYPIDDEAIEFRENEIDHALYDFLDVVLEGDVFLFSKEVDTEMFMDCKEHFLGYLAHEWDERVRRPMYLENETGEVFYTEYPYDYLEPEDFE